MSDQWNSAAMESAKRLQRWIQRWILHAFSKNRRFSITSHLAGSTVAGLTRGPRKLIPC
ncbi:hypothetical protein DPMN_128122 [Dreissena polymorpha]|uniref:Uncharacterized protein n=1 Tax=Dreissena polymorpha TaxID=45954 RepID=A0A9D4H397_DREPO|nr:hypothetical protein DPMN_128122 [Dreissena polymorpha]